MSITNNYNVILENNNNVSFPGRLFVDQIQLVNYGASSECILTADTDGKLLANGTDAFGDTNDTVLPLAKPVLGYNSKNVATVSCKILVVNSTDNETQTDLRIDDNGHLLINGLLTTVGAAVPIVEYPATINYSYDNYLPGVFTAQFVRVVSGNGLYQVVFTADDDGNLLLNGNVPASAPANTVLPAVTGTDLVGSTLTSTDGTWTGAPPITFTYSWYRYDDNAGTNPVLISGATSHTYVLQSADNGKYVRCLVTATDDLGAIGAYSNYTSQVKTPVVNTVAPAITGSEVDGEILTCSAGTYTGNVVGLTYQWYRANADHSSPVAISGETGTTHVLVPDDVGKTLKCVVTCNGFYGQSVVTDSNWTGVIAVPATTNWDDFLDSLSLTHRWTLGDSLVDKGSGGINLTETTNHVTPSISLIQETAYNGARLYKSGEGSATLTGNGFYVPTDDFMIGFIIKPNSADMARSIDLLTFNNGGGKNSLSVTIDNGIIVVHEQVTGYGGDYYCYNPHTLTVNETYLVLFNQPNAGARSITWVKLSDGTIDGTTTYPSAPSGLWNGTGALYVGNGSTDGIVQDIIWRYGALNGTEKTDIISNFIAAA